MADRRISFIISANLQNWSKNLKKATQEMDRMAARVQSIGNKMSATLTAPALAAGGIAVKAWDTQAKAIAQVEAGLNSTAGAVGYTSSQLQKLASDLQKNTLFGDEEILRGATAQLLTFTNITGKQFERTQKAALDLATRLDGDLKGAAIQLGKALNDPVGNLSALSRSGVQFTDEQTKLIKSLAQSGQMMKAQNIILNELEKQYGGSAEAAAKADSGLIQLKNTIGDTMESFGKIITGAIRPFIGNLKSIVQRINELDRNSKIKILKLTAAIATIGPVITGVGLAMAGLAATISALMSPVILVVGGLAALSAGVMYVYENWDALIERVSDISWWRNALVEMLKFFIQWNPFDKVLDSYNFIARKFGAAEIPNPFNMLADQLDKLKTETKDYTHEFGSFTDAIVGAASQITGLNLLDIFSFGRSSINSISSIKAPTIDGGVAQGTIRMVQNYKGPDMSQLDATARKMNLIGQATTYANRMADTFTNSFGAGMANIIVQGDKLADVLKNIGKLLASSAIQTAISALLTGGLGGTGFFGSGGGLFGSLLGKATSVNDALIRSDGSVIQFHPDDNLLAMKDFGNLGGGVDISLAFEKALDRKLQSLGPNEIYALSNMGSFTS